LDERITDFRIPAAHSAWRQFRSDGQESVGGHDRERSQRREGRYELPYNSFNLSSGVQFGFYFPDKNGRLPGQESNLYGLDPKVGPQYGTRKAAVKITTPEGPALDQYWESGPQFTGWGEVVGKYPDGTPAIVEASVGRGWVILSGVHPEAPANWRRGIAFSTPVSDDTEYARMLILSALNRTTLSHC
jgi:hypothetical protein